MSGLEQGELFGQTALVTGANRGIGKSIAIELARAGAFVVGTATTETGASEIKQYLGELDLEGQGLALNLLREETELTPNRSALKRLRLDDDSIEAIAEGNKKVVVVNDVADVVKKVYKDALEAAKDSWGSSFDDAGKAIQILVNNAGLTRDGLVARMPLKDWHDVIDVNLTGSFLMIHAVLPDMMRRKYGRIVNNSSFVGEHGNPGQANYSASKAGLLGVTKSVAKELGSRNVLVNAITPGYVVTRLTESLPDEATNTMIEHTPVKSPVPSEQVARAVVYLASPNNTHVTGVVLPVDGGLGM